VEDLTTWGKLVLMCGAIVGGVVGAGKMKFLTKKDFEQRKDTCQREMIDRIKSLHVDQTKMSKEHGKDMGDLREFMGEVTMYMKMKNGGI